MLGATTAVAATTVVGCRRCGEDAGLPLETRSRPTSEVTPNAPLAPGEWRELFWPPDEAPPEGEAALLRKGDGDDAPLIVALHGRGESGRGLVAGASGFRDDYAIESVEAKLLAGTITADDLGGFATADRIRALQASLTSRAYQRPTLLTPYCPTLRDQSAAGAQGFASFVCEQLLRRAGEELGRQVPREQRGIDGISMGGRLALQIAILRPEMFATVGAMQPAIRAGETRALADALEVAHRRSPFTLRLVSSQGDPFLTAVGALDAALAQRSVPHLFVITPGPHDYAWNRGPGAAELLLFHERVLRGMTSP